jgi:acylpyruvate hydrolase
MKSIKYINNENYPLGTFLCLGQNYEKHIKEMGSKKTKDPVVFLKPPAAYTENRQSVILPDFSDDVHYEVELVLIIKNDVYNINADEALNYIDGFSVGIDMTLRDIQKNAKDNGKPWAVAKGFYTSAPIAPAIKFTDETDLNNLDLLLELNGEMKQAANTSEMVMKSAEIIAYLSKVFSLSKGDVIFTGTPEGVGKVEKGDLLYASLSSNGSKLTEISVNVE